MAPERIELITLSKIVAGNNDRLQFNQEALRELADSIQAIGLAQPITVRPLYQDGEPIGLYQIIAGERRYRACKLLGMETIPALVREMNDSDAAALMLAENLQRVDISPLEAARAFDKRIKQFGWSLSQIAAHANVKPALVSRRLKLLGLCPEAAFLLEKNNLPIGHAEIMAQLDSNRQMLALRLFQGSRAPSLSEFNTYCSRLMEEQTQESMFDLTELTIVAQEQAIAQKMQRTGAGVKRSKDVPEAQPKKTIGETIESYIADLANSGCNGSALAVCALYDALVRSNLARVPAERAIPEHLTEGYQRPPTPNEQRRLNERAAYAR